jgi:hypothetical protein
MSYAEEGGKQEYGLHLHFTSAQRLLVPKIDANALQQRLTLPISALV